MVARVMLIAIAMLSIATPLHTQERFSFFHASTPEMAERMLTVAQLRDGDVVMDLGSGNGLIPLTAARMNPRVQGRGVEIDPKLVDESNAQARREGLADRVRFEHRNAFDVDLRDVTVVTMWVFPELMRLLRPIILERARPGTRVVTSSWDLGTWAADHIDHEGTAVYLWIVPARVAGGWHWTLNPGGRDIRYASFIEQRFQVVEGVGRAGDRREILEGMSLRGAEIRFSLKITVDGLGLTQHEFSGTVNGDEIVGTVKLEPATGPSQTLPWRASRVERSDYFAPTGTETFQPPNESLFSVP
jgi:precorrin-6B methylase 2